MNASAGKRKVAVVTGTRAEFGLLEPVMRAVDAHPALELSVIVAGAHFLPPAETWREVESRWGHRVGGEVPMQQSGHLGRFHDAIALSHGVSGMAQVFEEVAPHWVVVLGDRVEALAGAASAAIGGVAVAHLHGGDRAEGVADESIRHAISKLAHLHLAATAQSAERLRRMGEDDRRVHMVGSPAIDTLGAVRPADDALWELVGRPTVLLLYHPIGDSDESERRRAAEIGAALAGERVLWLMPNHDPGRDGVLMGCADASVVQRWTRFDHLPRERFLSVAARLAAEGGVIVGNSSAGLIECAALRLPCVDVGERQAGRERPGTVVHTSGGSEVEIRAAAAQARLIDSSRCAHPYGDGTCGVRSAELFASIDPLDRGLLRKRNAY
ncbi:MAG: UDP-N-acetylglucosamine 2-epimerase (hydrolyzing) [Planctomycetes bacterium]|nr:UDP-N-acetylglucosamine 2-epimerase (hydrolyzing) [Planctomycetota bacterium]